MAKKKDKQLLNALLKAYTARATLFHTGVKAAKIDLLIAEIDSIKQPLRWNLDVLGVSELAFKRVSETGGALHQVFVHPDIIFHRPHLIAYYRNVVTISKKGIGQILFSTTSYESGRKIEKDKALEIAQAFNRILSGVIDDMPDYTIELSRQAVLAEMGTELQGTWANTIGKGAAKAVERLFEEYIAEHKLGEYVEKGRFKLNNGWSINFASEPDVAFLDQKHVKQIAIEIKGSLDVAGAQTRYGEALKSFRKQLAENPRCHTVYLASCFTDAVIRQVKTDGQVRDWFNLTSILYDDDERDLFLRKVFYIVETP